MMGDHIRILLLCDKTENKNRLDNTVVAQLDTFINGGNGKTVSPHGCKFTGKDYCAVAVGVCLDNTHKLCITENSLDLLYIMFQCV